MRHKPDSYPDLSPYLLVDDVEASVVWLESAFGASRLRMMPGPDGQVTHGEARIGDGVVMLGRAPGSPAAMVHLYLPDPDAALARALDAGGTLLQEMAESGDGDRRGGVAAPDGTQWYLARQVED